MDVYRFLERHGIDYERHDHPAVFTCEEATRLVPELPAARTKNLFLRDKKGRRHFLVAVGYEKTVDLKGLSMLLGAGPLSLASPARLERHLGVAPGAVSILGLVNDAEGDVEVVVDAELWRADAFGCHPLVNTSTLVLRRADLERLITLTGHRLRVLDVPARAVSPSA